MKSTRLIARLDIKGENVVKGVQTEGLRVVGSPKELALKYYNEGADEIIYMDIVASLYDRNLDFAQLKSVCKNVFVPITVGGGIRSIQDINDALRSGADKVAINTFAIRNPKFLEEAVQNFGSQCIALSIEAKQVGTNKWEAYVEGGREKTGVDVVEWARKAIVLGVGEIILTSIDQDGGRKGYDIKLVKEISKFARVPIIVHGGAGNPEHIFNVVQEALVDAVSVSSIFHYNEFSINDIKKSLIKKKLLIRLT